MANNLLEKLKKAGSVKNSDILAKSIFFNERDVIQTPIPALNIALSGDLNGGLSTSITVIGGESRTFKTLSCLFMVSAYLNKYPDAICLYYDNEYGSNPRNFEAMGIDINRVIHIPVEHIEQMKFDVKKRLDEIERGDRVIVFIDSIGSMPSVKELEDAEDEKVVVDMQRAKSIRSFFRILHSTLPVKDIPAVIVAHSYKTMELYSKNVLSGGTSLIYYANNVWIITKAQEKEGTDIIGYNFTINIEKSRFVKEKCKIPFTVLYDGGIQKYSALMDIALESGHCIKPSQGWYSKVDKSTGEIDEKKYRLKDTNTKEFWDSILKDPTFNEFVGKKYKIPSNRITDEEVSEVFDNIEEEENV